MNVLKSDNCLNQYLFILIILINQFHYMVLFKTKTGKVCYGSKINNIQLLY